MSMSLLNMGSFTFSTSWSVFIILFVRHDIEGEVTLILQGQALELHNQGGWALKHKSPHLHICSFRELIQYEYNSESERVNQYLFAELLTYMHFVFKFTVKHYYKSHYSPIGTITVDDDVMVWY